MDHLRSWQYRHSALTAIHARDNLPPLLRRNIVTRLRFDPALASDLRTSLELFLDDLVSHQDADFRQILATDTLYLNGRLAKFYGADLKPEDAPFQKVSLEPKERAGVLTHPYLLSVFAYTAASSPIHRGVFVSRSVLGR